MVSFSLSAKPNKFRYGDMSMHFAAQYNKFEGYTQRVTGGLGLNIFLNQYVYLPTWLYVGDRYLRVNTNLLGVGLLAISSNSESLFQLKSLRELLLIGVVALTALESGAFRIPIGHNWAVSLGYGLFNMIYIQNHDSEFKVKTNETRFAMGLLRFKATYYLNEFWGFNVIYEPGIIYNSQKTFAQFVNFSFSLRFH